MSVVAEIKCIVLTGWLFTRDNKTGYKTSHVALWYGGRQQKRQRM